jgi:hypothetical protein
VDLKSESLRLRQYTSRPPDDVARREIMAALASKFEGIQAVAAEVLASWRDAPSKAELKRWFLQTLERPSGWAIRSVAVRELSRLLDADDASWVLELYFGTMHHLLQHELSTLAAALPLNPAKSMIDERARDQDPRVRHAALKVWVRSTWGDPKDLLQPYAADPDPLIRKVLRAWKVI